MYEAGVMNCSCYVSDAFLLFLGFRKRYNISCRWIDPLYLLCVPSTSMYHSRLYQEHRVLNHQDPYIRYVARLISSNL